MSGASNDDRPPMVIAMRWVHQITTIAFEMAFPAGWGIGSTPAGGPSRGSSPSGLC